ncbi:MAG: NUDIX domain-containing protein [Chloroflexi bacterium]|nr:NUDIX domain-containing protein [Chloroflexota bacterium]
MTNFSSEWPPRNVICVGTVVLKDDRVLLVRQAEGTSLAGSWSIPWGVLERGEWPEVAAVRETKEESGITARIEGLLGIQNLSWQSAIGIIFLCRHESGNPIPDGKETDLASYFSLEDVDALGKQILPWCKWLVARVLTEQHYVIPGPRENPYEPNQTFL